MKIEAPYGWTALSPAQLSQKIQTAHEFLSNYRKKHRFDALAFSGSSGSAIAFVLSVSMGIPVIYVRKEDEVSHGQEIECNSSKEIKKYIIVDDFVCSGSTVRHIYDSIEAYSGQNFGSTPKCLGIYLYSQQTGSVSVTKKKQLRVINF